MSDIFVSYAREDIERVEPLTRALKAQGWTLWWDRNIAPGKSFDETIESEISRCRVVIVVWTNRSVESRWVKNEALEGMDRDILLPVLFDDVRIPVAFRQYQAARLIDFPRKLDEHEFTGLIHSIDEIAPRKPADKARQIPLRKPSGGSSTKWIAAVLLALLLLMAPWIIHNVQSQSSATASAAAPRLAILHFRDPLQNSENDFLIDSIGSEIYGNLKKTSNLILSAEEAGWNIPPNLSDQQIEDRLGVRYVLSGEVKRFGALIVVVAELRDVQSGITTWSHQYQGVSENLQVLNRELTQGVLSALNLNNATQDDTTDNRQQISSASYSLYLRGKDALRKPRDLTNLQQATDHFTGAVRQNPKFSLAWAGLCRSELGIFEYTKATGKFEAAEKACHRALTIDSNQSEVYLALGNLYEYSGQYQKAEAEFSRALRIDPSFADAYIGLGRVLPVNGGGDAEKLFLEAVKVQPGYTRAINALGVYYLDHKRLYAAIDQFTQLTLLSPNDASAFNNLGVARIYAGEFQAAIDAWQRANEIEPVRGALSNMGTAYFSLRRFESAEKMYKKALENTPDDFRLWGNLGDTYRLIGNHESDAKDAYERGISLASAALEINAQDPEALVSMALALACTGRGDAAGKMLGKTLAGSDNSSEVFYLAAVTTVILGQWTRAIELLQKSVDLGYSTNLIKADPQFDVIKQNREFRQLIDQDSPAETAHAV